MTSKQHSDPSDLLREIITDWSRDNREWPGNVGDAEKALASLVSARDNWKQAHTHQMEMRATAEREREAMFQGYQRELARAVSLEEQLEALRWHAQYVTDMHPEGETEVDHKSMRRLRSALVSNPASEPKPS